MEKMKGIIKKIEEFKITLKNDYLFKRLLGVEENKDILKDFLECVLDIPEEQIMGLELLDKELKKDKVNDRLGILDVKIRLKNGCVIDVEIQEFWDASFVGRTLFYWAKMYIEDFKEGESYSALNKCITINIVGKGFNLNDKVHSKYILKEEKTNEKLTDILEVHFLNLEKVEEIWKKEEIRKDRLIKWLKFINSESKEEREMIASTSLALKILNEKIEVLNLNEEEKAIYESRMKLKSDIASISESRFNEGIKEGLKEGVKEGVKKGSYDAKIETARLMKKESFDTQMIVKMTGLSKETIEKL